MRSIININYQTLKYLTYNQKISVYLFWPFFVLCGVVHICYLFNNHRPGELSFRNRQFKFTVVVFLTSWLVSLVLLITAGMAFYHHSKSNQHKVYMVTNLDIWIKYQLLVSYLFGLFCYHIFFYYLGFIINK